MIGKIAMITSLIQQAPAETTTYMVAGYSVIFGIMLIYIISLVLRNRNLKRDMQSLHELERQDK
jgi:hypothetical protein